MPRNDACQMWEQINLVPDLALTQTGYVTWGGQVPRAHHVGDPFTAAGL